MGIKHFKGRKKRQFVHIKTPPWILKGGLKKYEMKLLKKDWEDLQRAAEMNLKQAMISVEQFQTLLDLSTKRLAEFPADEPKKNDDTEKEADEILKDLIDGAAGD